MPHLPLKRALFVGALILLAQASAATSRAERGPDRALGEALREAAPALDVQQRDGPLRPGARRSAADAVRQAAEEAEREAIASRAPDALARARRELEAGHHRAARRQLEALRGALTSRAPEHASYLDRAQILLARVELDDDRPARAAAALTEVSDATPIEDYRLWLLAAAREAAGDPRGARRAYAKLARLEQSPIVHRAKVHAAHMAFEARDWETAADELGQIERLYPDYPRRPKALLERARALEEMGELARAAQAYDDAWFAYPFRPEGKEAAARRDRLVAGGQKVRARSVGERYARYRSLRINKHWDTARALFSELARELEEERGPHDRLVHAIWEQLALNAYIPKRYEEALLYLERLKQAYESGERAGISRALLYRYLAATLAKFGETERALDEIGRAYATPGAKRRARAQFLRDHGKYGAALRLYDEMRSPQTKLGWDHSWLLYKSGELKEAKRQFERLAQMSGGRRRAKYLYWSARAAERAGLLDQARAIFARVEAEHRRTYYAIQARNRLADLDARGRSTELFAGVDRMTDAERGAQGALSAERRARPESPTADLLASLSRQARSAPRSPVDLGWRAEELAAPLLCPARADTLACRIASAPEVNARVRRTTPTAPRDQAVMRSATEGAPLAPSPARKRARVKLESEENARHRPAYYRDARIHWEGPEEPPIALTSLSEARVDGPKPDRYASPYVDQEWRGGLDRALERAGALFPQLERAAWLRDVGMMKEARWAVRDVALEYRALRKKPVPRARPYELERARMIPLIDNRRQKKATWGYTEDKPRWPIPKGQSARERLRERQAAIIERRRELRPVILHALQEVGDYYMVRRFALEDGLRTRASLSRAYPRAFPDLVVPQAERWGVNPYLIWALMTVESSYNPDSVSVARALGLLQVIPRTGHKTAQLLGDEEFGHDDLLDEDVAIRHGVFYFSRLVRKFNGQELLAMAGYNGGPHRVAEWIDMRGDMPLDEFVEEIPYDQAREYTKKVTRFVHLYLRVYEGSDDLYIGQNLDRDWAPMPNF